MPGTALDMGIARYGKPVLPQSALIATGEGQSGAGAGRGRVGRGEAEWVEVDEAYLPQQQ